MFDSDDVDIFKKASDDSIVAFAMECGGALIGTTFQSWQILELHSVSHDASTPILPRSANTRRDLP
jgi:hypothetical protein